MRTDASDQEAELLVVTNLECWARFDEVFLEYVIQSWIELFSHIFNDEGASKAEAVL